MRFLAPFIAITVLSSLASNPAEAHPRGYMQILQNALADRYGLPRYADRNQLAADVKKGRLVRLEATDAYRFDAKFAEIDIEHRELYEHVQPWTKAFLDQVLGEAHAKFGTQYLITSAVRTQVYQQALCRRNVNAICGGTGWHRSAHLTGATIDIGRVGLSEAEQAWLRQRMNRLWSEGKLLYIPESRSQMCFHVMISPSFLPKAAIKTGGERKGPKKRKHATRR